MAKHYISLIGVGGISGKYLENITYEFNDIEVIGLYDIIRERAEDAQAKFGVKKVYDSLEEAINDPEADIVLNLTRPLDHYWITKMALEAGKHVYTEKPLTVELQDGIELVKLAREKGLMLCGAPDTFMGGWEQTARKLVDAGMIGDVVGCQATWIGHGPELFHPDPEFYFHKGAEPLHDMGPYYLTAIINIMGGVKKVSATGKIAFPQRVIKVGPKANQIIDVDAFTTMMCTMEFASGAIGSLFMTMDVWYPVDRTRQIEIFGTEGTLFLPDPDLFNGKIQIYRPEDGRMLEYPISFDYAENSRGVGIADMAKAIDDGRAARADSQQILHVLDIIEGFEKSARTGTKVNLETVYRRPEPMKKIWRKGEMD